MELVPELTATAEPEGALGTPDEAQVLIVENLHVAVEGHEILRGVDLVVRPGELHALMGPNGSGKSTLANTLAGNPGYEVTAGRIVFQGAEVTSWAADARARAGMFLAFQYPEEIPGVPVSQFLRQAVSARRGTEMSVLEVRVALMEWMKRLDMDPAFAEPLPERGLLRRREEAQRDPPDGDAGARSRHPGRDRLRAWTSTPFASSPVGSKRSAASGRGSASCS